jgi:hypothetical protein
MRKMICLCAVVFIAGALPLLAQTTSGSGGTPTGQGGTSVTLQNEESVWFYFVLDPAELVGLTPSSPLLDSKVAGFFAKGSSSFPFTMLGPNTSLTLQGLSEGAHLLVGFFASPDSGGYPVRAIGVSVDRRLSQRFYGIFSDPPLLTLQPGKGLLANFKAPVAEAAPKPQPAAAPQTPQAQPGEPSVAAPLAQPPVTPPAAAPQTQAPPAQPTDGGTQIPAAPQTVSPALQASTAASVTTAPPAASPPPAREPLAEIAHFSPTFSPVVFTREAGKDFSVHPISESRYWNRNGTRIAAVSGSRSYDALVLQITSSSGFSKDVSYFFYLFSSRTLGQENSYTVEIKPIVAGRTGGIALLWKKGQKLPLSIGKVEIDDFSCLFTAQRADIPDELNTNMGDDASADFTAGYFDAPAGMYEEFYYVTLPLSGFPAPTR